MQLITLNAWGGRLLKPLLTFIKDQSKDIDVFCFQEIYSSPEKKTIARDMYSQVLEELTNVLEDYQVFYSAHLKNRDIDQNTSFHLSTGISTFIKKSIKLKENGEFYIYRSGFELINGDYKSIPRNIQYFVLSSDDQDYLICNFHGIWAPKDKLDTGDRLGQSKMIKEFLNMRKEKIVLCGDYNLQPSTKSVAILEKNMRNLIKENHIISTRSNGYKGITRYADYILVSPDINVEEFRVIDTSISDHLPLYLRFT